jgi:hypothetical protein
VGERGPEVFVPKVSGRIVPNNQLTSVSSPATGRTGGVDVNIYGDVRPNDWNDFMAQAQNRARRAASDGVRR